MENQTEDSMKRIAIAVALVALLLTVASQAQTPVPKPGPEQKKLHVWNGDWTYEGETMATPLGPADKFTGKQTAKMTAGGFVQEWRWEENHPGVLLNGIQLTAYDPVNKNYVFNNYGSNGWMQSGTGTVTGNVWDWSGSIILGSKQYKMRAKDVLSTDLMSDTFTVDISTDGNTWTPLMVIHISKVKAAPKK
jgi:Protein of unknown function (DUF1579)